MNLRLSTTSLPASRTDSCRFIGIDWIRCISSFMVILLHTSAITFIEFKEGWEVGALFDSLTRCSVPLFFLISGFLLLDGKQENLSSFLLKRFLRIFLPFLMLVLIYAIVKKWGVEQIISAVFLPGPMDYHLWYVYSIIGIYLTIPVLNPLFKEKNNKVLTYYLWIWFISFILYQTLISIFSFSWNPFKTFNFYYFQGYLGYVVLGGWLRKLIMAENNDEKWQNCCKKIIGVKGGRFNKESWLQLSWGGVNLFALMGFLAIGVSIFYLTFIATMKQGRPSEIFFEYTNLLVFFQTLMFYLAFNRCRCLPTIIPWLAKYTYWIYLLHILCLQLVLSKVDILAYPYYSIPIASIAVFALSFIFAIPLLFIEKLLLTKIYSYISK